MRGAAVELDAAVTQFAKRFPGLHFARFDLRANSMEDLKAGRFIVTEVGGCCHVSSLVRDGSLRIVLPTYEPPPLPIQLVYPASRLVSASLRAFIALAVETRSWDFVEM